MRVLIAVALLMCGTAESQQAKPYVVHPKGWDCFETFEEKDAWAVTCWKRIKQPQPAKQEKVWPTHKEISGDEWHAIGGQDKPGQEKAQPEIQSTGAITVIRPQPANFMLVGLNGKVLVTIHLDGTIEYGKDYTPDKAAKVFWEALGRDTPCKELRKR